MIAEPAALLDGAFSALAAAVSSGAATARSLAELSLSRAAKARDLYGAFLSIDEEGTLRQAEGVDRRVASGERLPLAGVPLAVKDNINVAGRPSTAGSRILAGLRLAGRRDLRRPPRRGGRGRRRQDELRRVRDGLVERELRLRARAQSLGSVACAGRLVRRLGRRRGRARGAARDRDRHRRLRPPAGGPVRARRVEAHVRARLALRPHRLRVVLRPGRGARAQRRRRGPRVHGHGGRGPERRDVARDVRPGRGRWPGGGGEGEAGRPSRGGCLRRGRPSPRGRRDLRAHRGRPAGRPARV